MAVVISLLRAVNVGGHNRVPMESLREIGLSLGFKEPRTYVQSGNMVFQTTERNLTALAKRMEAAIEEKFGFRPTVVLRTLPEMREIVERNPFALRSDVTSDKLLVTFLESQASHEALARIDSAGPGGEEIIASQREFFIFFPHGAGRSKLSAARMEKIVGCSGTARNWNSVLKLLEMAEELARHK